MNKETQIVVGVIVVLAGLLAFAYWMGYKDSKQTIGVFKCPTCNELYTLQIKSVTENIYFEVEE